MDCFEALSIEVTVCMDDSLGVSHGSVQSPKVPSSTTISGALEEFGACGANPKRVAPRSGRRRLSV